MEEKTKEKRRKATCPHCEEKISYLLSREDVIEEYMVWVNESGNMNRNQTDTYESRTGIRFFCPKCREKVAKTREEAEKILK